MKRHSWSLSDWPEDVFPNSTQKAKYTVRAHRDSLVREGALVRVGRELVIIGERYHRWLAKQAGQVPGYSCPANRSSDKGVSA